jgi:hypothetical protein
VFAGICMNNARRWLNGDDHRPQWRSPSLGATVRWWLERWAMPRTARTNSWRSFEAYMAGAPRRAVPVFKRTKRPDLCSGASYVECSGGWDQELTRPGSYRRTQHVIARSVRRACRGLNEPRV